MSTIAQNLTALQNAKAAIAEAITDKGGELQTGDGFADFAAAILAIPTVSEDPSAPSGGVVLPTLTAPAGAADILSGKEAIDADGNVLVGTLEVRHGTVMLESTLKGMDLQLITHNLGKAPKIVFVTKTDAAATRASNVSWAVYYTAFGLQKSSGSIYAVTDASSVPSILMSSGNRVALSLNATSFQLGMTDSKYSWAGGEAVDWWVFG